MNQPLKKIACAASLAALALFSGCGGGGDVAAAKTDFSLSPAEFKLTASTGDLSCSKVSGFETTVTIIGGQPPYRIVNSWPDVVTVSDTEYSGKNPTFKITTIRGCVDPLVITVLDYHSRSTTFKVTISPGEAAK